MEPIVSPWLIYVLGLAGAIESNFGFIIVVSFVCLCVLSFIVLKIKFLDEEDNSSRLLNRKGDLK